MSKSQVYLYKSSPDMFDKLSKVKIIIIKNLW